MRQRLLLALFAAVAFAPAAAALDLHAFWDQRCQECHGHSATFARGHLTVEDGKLLGRHHRDDLARFLAQHHMNAETAGPIGAMLLAQATTPPVFQQKCARCHQTAAELARTSLVLKDGKAVGKESGAPVADYLKTHGRLTPDELPIVVDALTRLLGEVSPKSGG